MGISDRRGLNGSSVRRAERELELAASEYEIVDLTAADTRTFPAPNWVLEAFMDAASGGGRTYTPYRGDAGVRHAVAANLSSLLGVPLNGSENVALTPGTQAGLFCALAAVVSPGDAVVILDPDYMSNERLVRFLGGTSIRVPLDWETNPGSAEIDLEALTRAFAARPVALLFSNPNNPTGSILGPVALNAIAELADRYGCLVIADELYSRLVFDDRPFTHFAAIGERPHGWITTIGPSKTESMSGYRVGVTVGPAWLIDRIEDVMSSAVLRAPAYAQHTLVKWGTADVQFVGDRVRRYQELRDLAVARLNANGVTAVTPSAGTSYLFPRFTTEGRSDQEVALALKRRAGILVNPGYQFGDRGVGRFRLCIAQDQGVLQRCLDAIAAVLAEELPA
jgi:aspartate/methionine/tyrosine aminotransferase